MSRLRQFRSVLSYVTIPALSAVTPLLVLPALTAAHGAPGLAAIGIGQSLGSTAAVIGELGWSVVGPQRVARADAVSRSRLFESALATKLSVLAVVVPIFAFSAYFLAVDFKLAAALIAVAFGLTALSPSWYFTGLNRPLLILFCEAVPRLVLSVSVAFAILAGLPLEFYGISLAVAVIITWFAGALVTHQRLVPRWSAFREGPASMRQQLPLTGGRVVSVLYTFLPVTIVALVSPGATATYTAIDRLIRMALSLLGGVPQRLQSWVGVSNGAERSTRSRRSLQYNGLLGVVAGIGFAGVTPLAAPLIFSGAVSVSYGLSALGGAVIFVVCASRGFGLSLVAEGRANWIAAANVVAAAVGIVSIFGLASALGVEGGVIGTLFAEAAGLSMQALFLFASVKWIRRNLDDA